MKPNAFPTREIRRALLAAAIACATSAGASETATLVSPAPSAGAEMAFAASVDGTEIAIGAPGENAIAGAIYVTDCAALPCTTPLRIAPDDVAAGDAFGTAVGLSGDTLIASAPGSEPGVVYVYARNGSGWSEQARLTPSGGAAGERFGVAASLSGDRIAVGADPATHDAGAVYVFARNGTAWSQEARLAPGGAAQIDAFGSSVALDGDTLLAGAPLRAGVSVGSYARGAVYVFTRAGASWTPQATLTAAASANGDLFGTSLALAGDRAAIGAPYAASAQGTAYVFARTGSAWTQHAELNASDGAAGDEFGWSVALGEDKVIVGAPYKGQLADAPCGGAYVFDAELAETSEGAIDAPLVDDLAGWAVAASGSRWIATAPGHVVEDAEHAGAAYWFDGEAIIFRSGFDLPGACTAEEGPDV